MKRVSVLMDLFEKGDRVCTPCGEGVVMADEEPPQDRDARYVWVQHDEGLSANPSNKPQELEACIVCKVD